LLAFDYPEFEVIVVNDGSDDRTLERVREAFALEPYAVFVRHVFGSQPVRGIYRSADHPNLVVLDKVNGGKADAWNAGLNVARYRYVCGVDADTVFDRKALLKVMRVAVQDPARIVGVTSQITTAREPEQAMAAPPGRRPIDLGPLVVYQHLDFLRAFVNNRLAWSRLGFMLCSPGGFQIWRRDVLEEVGGYSTAFTCEDIELTFRVHERFLRERRDYRIHCLPDSIGVTEGPDSVAKLVAQRERWQRVINETVVHYRRMWFNPRYRTVGLIGTPFYLLTEVLSPAIELVALAALVASVALGVFELDASRRARRDGVHERRSHRQRDPPRRSPVPAVPEARPGPPPPVRAARPRSLSAGHLLGAPQGILALLARGQGLVQVRAERARRELRRSQSLGRSTASTSSACVSGFTRRRTFATIPSASITKVERSMPMYVLPKGAR
jgi:glycosyltransferase involved in cell wall biosynthesis